MVRQVKRLVGIPVAVKLSPYFTSLANVVAQLQQTGVARLQTCPAGVCPA